MILTESLQEKIDFTQTMTVCVRAHKLVKDRHHDITVSTGNHVSKTLAFHYVAHLIHSSLPSLSFSMSVCPTLDTAAVN